MPEITMYTTEWCGWCNRAKSLLRSKGIEEWTEINVDELPGGRAELAERTGGTTVPQILVDDHHVGGFDALAALDRTGELDRLLEP
ncbi:MAG: glutaredoxin 3 [Acidimicrobiia bacterium]|nr:glutaredoxin 3 [Acidimicrobiia bacterium]NNF09805.1 glutaredoxin 3 [Acidimicrobiia bacterium]NNL70291.1 glutaredoxin 3 [Acidimicrobiia bacterium]